MRAEEGIGIGNCKVLRIDGDRHRALAIGAGAGIENAAIRTWRSHPSQLVVAVAGGPERGDYVKVSRAMERRAEAE